ncbi:oxidoreductase [Oscillatoriales cyanobacterium USR001]|nr:oxidoreductase [Oscillatoriales cyanobacterium USR001]
MKIGIAILGAGRWGIHLIRNFLEHPQSQILAVVDPHPERLAAVQKQFNFDANIVLATDWSAVEKLPGLVAVAIATPASTHNTLITAALQQSYHVFAEKPLTLNLEDAIALCQLAEQQKCQLFVDHTYLFHPAIEAGKNAIQQGKLGNLRYGYAQRTHLEPVRNDVDALWDLAIHDIAIFNTWLGKTPIQVSASGTVLINQKNRNIEKNINYELPLDDLVWIKLTYPDGFQAFIHLCWINPDKQRRLAVVGSQGTLIFDDLLIDTPLIVKYGYSESDRHSNLRQSSEILTVEPVEPLQQVCDRFLHSIQSNTPSPISSGWIGVEFVRILSALSESLKLGGKTITIC